MLQLVQRRIQRTGTFLDKECCSVQMEAGKTSLIPQREEESQLLLYRGEVYIYRQELFHIAISYLQVSGL